MLRKEENEKQESKQNKHKTHVYCSLCMGTGILDCSENHVSSTLHLGVACFP